MKRLLIILTLAGLGLVLRYWHRNYALRERSADQKEEILEETAEIADEACQIP